MNIYIHFLTSAILFGFFYPQYGLISLLIFLGGFLVDIDHIGIHYLKQKSVNPFKTWNWFKKHGKTVHKAPFILHNVEFFVVVLVIAYFWNPAWFVIAGLMLHYSLDLIYELYWKIHTKSLSLFYYCFNQKK